MSWQNLLMEESPLLVRRTLAQRIGLNEAIALQQLHFVLTHIDSRAVEIDGARWVKASLEYWGEQFPFWSEATIKRTFQNLKQSGLIDSERGRESNVYRLDYAAVDQLDLQHGSICADETAQSDPSLPIGEVVEREKKTTAAGAAVSSSEGTLFGPPPPEQPKDELAELVTTVHDHHLAVFGDRMRVKAITPPRDRMYRKALKAVANDVDLCKRAIDGLKTFRDSRPDGSRDVAPSVIFETGPHSGKNLTEQIVWWADQADSGRAALPAGVPTVMGARVNERKLTVVQMYQQPMNSSLQQRGEQALHWLREHVKIEPVVVDGQVTDWRSTAA